jgi:hypothetical protein
LFQSGDKTPWNSAINFNFKKRIKMKTLKLQLIGICIVTLFFSAGFVFAGSVSNVLMGKQNAEAVKLLINCEHKAALEAIAKEEQADVKKYDKELGLVLKGVIFQELDKTTELDNLYNEMVVLSGRDMNTSKTEAIQRVSDMHTEIKLERKKKSGNEFCK